MIGGSFALAARRAGIVDRITGWDSRQVLDEACARGIIDGEEDSFETGEGCPADLIYLAAPVGGIMNLIRTRGGSFKSGAIVTDAGSTKREICRIARKTIPNGVGFVGGHPMAGSHNAGLQHANADLFRNAPYAVIVDEAKTANDSVPVVEDVIRKIGARPVRVTAQEHDRAVARVSHVPQLIATALACVTTVGVNESGVRLSGAGFSEMVRLAASRWSVWEDICRTNSDEIALALDELIGELEATRSSIGSGGFDTLRVSFEEANAFVRRLGSRASFDGSLSD